MAALPSTLLPLGLFLCLALLFTPAQAKSYNDSCMYFQKTITSVSNIHVHSKVYERNTNYTVSVPVETGVISVILRAVDKSDNLVGSWVAATEYCNDSVVYLVTETKKLPLQVTWQSPLSSSVTAVIIQAYTVDINGTARFSSLELKEGTTTTTSSKPSTTKPITTKTLTTNPGSDNTNQTKNTTTNPSRITTSTARSHSTPQTPTSSTSRASLSPIIDAVQILLVFFTSKLLF